MTPPATGDIVRPMPAAIWATAPSCTMVIPKSAACGVIASLKASAAAFPEPETTAMRNGPTAAAIMATDCEPFMASTSAPVRPIDFMPAAKSAAAAIRITTLLKPSPAPLQKRFDVSPTSCL